MSRPQIAQHHYPGSLALVAMHEAPMLFYGLWAAVQPFLETSTKQRVQFTYKARYCMDDRCTHCTHALSNS